MNRGTYFSISKGTNYEDEDPEVRVYISLTVPGYPSFEQVSEELDNLVAEVKRVY